MTILVDYAVRANFEFLEKIGVERWCFHDRDIAPDSKTIEVCKSYAIYMSVLGKTILEQKNYMEEIKISILLHLKFL